MAGMTDTAFPALSSAMGCGLVVRMVSSEGLVRGIDRTLEYADTPKKNGRFPFNLRRRSRQDGGGRQSSKAGPPTWST